jgi:hypothetical protein
MPCVKRTCRKAFDSVELESMCKTLDGNETDRNTTTIIEFILVHPACIPCFANSHSESCVCVL